MGQRLNLEIWNKGEVLANAYYHWSAYTSSAAGLVSRALDYIKSNPIQDDNYLLYAIRILEATDAGLTTREIERARNRSVLDGAIFAECQGRDAGLIGISEEEISETRYWSEGSAYIYLDEERVSFRVFFYQDKWEWEKEQREDYGNEDAKASNLEVVKFNHDDIKFCQWETYQEFLTSNEEPFLCVLDRTTVLTPIG